MNSDTSSHAAPTARRWTIRVLSAVLGVLWIWLFGFILSDIGDLEGPEFDAIEARHVDASLKEKADALAEQVEQLDVQIRRQEQIQENLNQSMSNARETMDQMMNLHRLSLAREVNPSETQQEALATSQRRFLDAQDQFEQANPLIAASNQEKFDLSQERSKLNRQLQEQRVPANEEYSERSRKHRFKAASLKMAFSVPVFLLFALVAPQLVSPFPGVLSW